MIKLTVNRRVFFIEESFQISSVIYQHQEHLGGGGNSSVECFIDVNDGVEYAVKIIPLEINNKEAERVHAELEILKSLKHQHIIAYFGHKLIKIKKRDKGALIDLNALFRGRLRKRKKSYAKIALRLATTDTALRQKPPNYWRHL